MIVFGGTNGPDYFNDVWELDLDILVWRELEPTGTRPGTRAGGSQLLDEAGNRMLVLFGKSTVFYNDLWALDLTPGSEKWTQLRTSGRIPSERACTAHGLDVAGGKFYIFGGFDYPPMEFYNDLYELDISEPGWTELHPAGKLPAPRRNAVGIFDTYNRSLLIFGGDNRDGFFGEAYCVRVEPVGVAQWREARPGQQSLFVAPTQLSPKLVKIRFWLPEPGSWVVRIVDMAGRTVRSFHSDGSQSTGGELDWDTRDEAGFRIPAGTYVCHLEWNGNGVSQSFSVCR